LFGLPSAKDAKEHLGYALENAGACEHPVLISVPHAARQYPRALINNLRVPADALLRLEDRYVDMLSRQAAAAGFTIITAKAPRALIDMNRAPDDIDADMLDDATASNFAGMSVKARGGLGLVPRRLSGYGDLWQNKWKRADFDTRIATYHAPYHEKISQILNDMRARHGGAILLDLHSMPSIASKYDEKPAQIVIGDRFGRSASGQMSETALAASRRQVGEAKLSFKTCLNHPYAGGYILQVHGNPQHQTHALQLEIDRALYLDTACREPTHGVHAMSALVLNVAVALADEIVANGIAQAAE